MLWTDGRTAEFESNGNAVPVLFYTTGTSFPLFFFCILFSMEVLRVCLLCPSYKLHVCLTGWLLTQIYVFICMISWMVRPPCEITDQLAVVTQNCFSTLFYSLILTLKQAPRMHQNAPLPDKKIKKWGAAPSPDTSPTGEGNTPDPTLLSAFGASILASPFHLRLEYWQTDRIAISISRVSRQSIKNKRYTI